MILLLFFVMLVVRNFIPESPRLCFFEVRDYDKERTLIYEFLGFSIEGKKAPFKLVAQEVKNPYRFFVGKDLYAIEIT